MMHPLMQQLMEHPVFQPAMAAGLLLLLVILVTTGLATRARARRERTRLLEQLDALFRENRAAAEATARLGERLEVAEERIRQLQTCIETAQPPEPLIEAEHAYAQAIRLVRRGASAERLVADFGLTRAEAELLVHLHGQRKTG